VDNGFFNHNNTLTKHGTKDIQVLHYRIWPWRILNRACISISNLPENIAWQTHEDDLRPEARGPLERSLGPSPHLTPSNAACVQDLCCIILSYAVCCLNINLVWEWKQKGKVSWNYYHVPETHLDSMSVGSSTIFVMLFDVIWNVVCTMNQDLYFQL
jgi:hypothetical protein